MRPELPVRVHTAVAVRVRAAVLTEVAHTEVHAPAAVTQAAVDHAPAEVVLPQEAADDADKQKG